MSDLDDIRSRLDRLTWELLEHIADSFNQGHTVSPDEDQFVLVRKYLQLVEDIQGTSGKRRFKTDPNFKMGVVEIWSQLQDLDITAGDVVHFIDGRLLVFVEKAFDDYYLFKDAASMDCFVPKHLLCRKANASGKQDKSGLDYLHKLNLQPKDIVQSELYPENKTFEFIKWERENDVQGLFYVWDLDENNEHYKTGAKVLIPNNSFGKVVAKPVRQNYEKLSNLDLQPGDLIESQLYPETVFLEFIKKIDDMTGYFKFVTKDEKYFKRLSGEMINLGLFTFGKVVKRAKQDKI